MFERGQIYENGHQTILIITLTITYPNDDSYKGECFHYHFLQNFIEFTRETIKL